MTSTTFVPTLSVYASPVTKKQHHKLTIAFVGKVFVKTAEWLKRLGCKFKSFVNKANDTVEFTFFYISDAVLQKIAAHNAKRAAQIAADLEAADEAAANGFDTAAAPIDTAKLAEAIATSKRLQAEAVGKGGNGFSAAGGGDAPAASYLPVAEVSVSAFVPATVEQLNTLTKNVLKDACRQFNLKVSGTKAQLCDRLVGHISADFCAK